jgi:hypothetical protein
MLLMFAVQRHTLEEKESAGHLHRDYSEVGGTMLSNPVDSAVQRVSKCKV